MHLLPPTENLKVWNINKYREIEICLLGIIAHQIWLLYLLFVSWSSIKTMVVGYPEFAGQMPSLGLVAVHSVIGLIALIATFVGLRRRFVWAVYATILLATFAIPSWAFLFAIGCLWFIAPQSWRDLIADECRSAFKQKVQANNNNNNNNSNSNNSNDGSVEGEARKSPQPATSNLDGTERTSHPNL